MNSRLRFTTTYRRAGKKVLMYRRAARRRFVIEKRRRPYWLRAVEFGSMVFWARKIYGRSVPESVLAPQRALNHQMNKLLLSVKCQTQPLIVP